jgi:hypothetical protein
MLERSRGIWYRVLAVAALACVLAATSASSVAPPEDWHVTADVAESCSCNISCPCNFGSPPTHDFCYGNRLYQITKGHYKDVDVSGLTFIMTFSMREWAKLYVSDSASDAQMQALKDLVPYILGSHASSGVRFIKKVPVVVERTKGKVKFSGPDSAVDMDVMTGYQGKAVTVENLPSPTFQHYTQYKSVVTRHQEGDEEFHYSGTTGFTSKLDIGGQAE